MKLSNKPDASARRVRRRERVLKTIGVLPSLATLGNLSCGLGAIYLCLLHSQAFALKISEPQIGGPRITSLLPSFAAAAGFLLILAMCFDGIDGRLARLARKTTEFGAQLDSLADVVSFGVAPAFMVLCIAQPATFVGMSDISFPVIIYWRAEWVMAAIYVCCAALRLARFNVENEEDESAHMEFRGLPTPGAAGAVIGLVICQQGLRSEFGEVVYHILGRAMPVYVLLLGLLMVSPFRYPHMVNAVLRSRRPFWQVVTLAMGVLVGFVLQFHITLCIVTSAYALAGPFNAAMYRIRGKPQPKGADELEPAFSEPDETFEDEEEPELHEDGGESTRHSA